MELQTIDAVGVRKLAQTFRARAAEAEPGIYRKLMLQTAAELDDLAVSLEAKGGAEQVLVDTDDSDRTP